MAASITAMSSTDPPRPLITGATLGIAAARSCNVTTVWFSTIFKKSIVFAKSALLILKAVCKAIVVSSA